MSGSVLFFEGEWLCFIYSVIELKWVVGSVVVRFFVRGLRFGKKRLILLLIFITVRD